MSERFHPGVHPDPDVLNAFAESALAEHERAECLAHLADCAQCREVVFLAQKAAEMGQPVAVFEPPVPFWQRFLKPMVVRSVVATAFAALVSFGLYRMMRPAEPPQLTASTAAPVEIAPVAKIEVPVPGAKLEEQARPASRSASPRPVAKEQEQPPASPAPAPATPAPVVAEPTVVATAPSPAPPVPAPPPGPVVPAGRPAEVAGTISDPAGAFIASARVELKNEDTGTIYTSTSDARGQYSIAGLAPGRYDFSVTSSGFKKFLKSGINVQPQQMARLDSTLDVGAATETVTVTTESALLKTESGDLSRKVDSTSADNLPLLSLAGGMIRKAPPASTVYTLPDKSTPVSVATKDKLVVAVDSAGALFVSKNSGKNWTRVKAAWKGKAVRVGVNANARFELTTDPASTWVSTDGERWSESRVPR